MSGQQYPPQEPRRPADVPFFAPGRGEYGGPPTPSGQPSGQQFGQQFGRSFDQNPHEHAPSWQGDAPRQPLEPVAGLGQAAVVLAVLVTACDLLSSGVDAAAGDTLGGALVVVVTSFGYLAGMVANLVVVGLFLARARRNAVRIAPHVRQRRAASWAWWGWIVPIASLFVPYQYVSDIWTASHERAPRGAAPKLGAWWAAWLVSTYLGSATFRFGQDGDVGTSLGLGVLSALAGLVALPFFTGVVRSIAAAQRP
ncbi:DUF4328 domain-containing protein [Kineococcus sp. SYSU DK003]|uniref:DUF4328 domain-containing protein n=1 Tax=Kineococcus sp. SYSU DK003 TaxID=3383124 RepID=UPI003D7CFBC8